jgi:hypothetical protein
VLCAPVKFSVFCVVSRVFVAARVSRIGRIEKGRRILENRSSANAHALMSSSLRFGKFLSHTLSLAGEAGISFLAIYRYRFGGRTTFYTIVKGPMLSRGRQRAGKRVRSLVIRNLCTSSRSCYSNVTPPLRRPARIALLPGPRNNMRYLCPRRRAVINYRPNGPRDARTRATVRVTYIKNQPLRHPIAPAPRPLRRSGYRIAPYQAV